jgi:hypothetical protein
VHDAHNVVNGVFLAGPLAQPLRSRRDIVFLHTSTLSSAEHAIPVDWLLKRPHDDKAAGNGKCREEGQPKNASNAPPQVGSSSSCLCGFHGSPAVNGCKIWGTSGGRQRTHVEMPVAAFPGDDTERPGSFVWGKPMQTRLVRDSQKRPRCSVDSGFLGVWNLESHLNIVSPQYKV